MKRAIVLFLTGLLVAGCLKAQTSDTLTNSSVIRMVKAKLADELIIEVIQSSEVRFELNESSVKDLTRENVSKPVIDAMKIAQPQKEPVVPVILQEPAKPTPAATSNQPVPSVKEISQPTPEPVKTVSPVLEKQAEPKPDPSAKPATSANVVEAFSYVVPLEDLLKFHEEESAKFSKSITAWDIQINLLLAKINETDQQILLKETELRVKKNEDPKSYSSEIMKLKQQLNELRIRYKQLKNQLIAEGLLITKKLGDIRDEQLGSIKNKYGDVSQQIKSFDADPAKELNPVNFIPAGLVTNENIAAYILPATEMLNWHQNTIAELRNLIGPWNAKVEEIIRKDAEIIRQTEPLETQLESYKSDPKTYKSEISSLKKQISAKEKERKQLANQMQEDARELVAWLKQDRTEILKAVEERFNDIIENINYAYQEKLKI